MHAPLPISLRYMLQLSDQWVNEFF